MYNLVVFASGNGTTLQAVIDAIKTETLNANISLVVSNNPNAYALERAKIANIPTYVIKEKDMYGMKVHTAVVEAKEEYSGVTLHYVNGEYDKGNTIMQTVVKVLPTDTPEDLSARVQAAEKIQLVEVLKSFVSNNHD